MSFAPVEPQGFPAPSWAWPRGGLDMLLQAALAPNEARALAAARAWFSSHDIDAAEFREHRLLVAIAARFGRQLADLPEYPRLAGLQRMLWTKARMALREAEPALREMVQSGVPVMLLKGAARIALNPDEQKARVSHDTDILVPPADYARALDILASHGWTPSTGESARCLRSRLAQTRSINLFYGHFGDIDLHQWGYVGAPELDQALWAGAVPREFFGVAVLVPSPEDRIALALASSALDAHAHSDWLVDCARTLQDGTLDEARLISILEAAGLLYQASVALGYLRDRIGIACPALDAIEQRAAGLGRTERVGLLLQMKPRCDWTWLSAAARGIAKQMRLSHQRHAVPRVARETWLRGRLSRLNASDLAKAQTPILSPIALGAVLPGRYRMSLSLAVELSGIRRRAEFELGTDQAYLTRLRLRDLLGRAGWYAARFEGELVIPEGAAGQLLVEVRPSKTLRDTDEAEQRRYAALPMRLLSATIRQL
ncbi:nucleotidyltransferase family protein [Sinirhodobacter sp. HNIBRBA609]|nr:nucleotidyltransferase family protein [Sinirhodobacter sp. HNIBRBA609]